MSGPIRTVTIDDTPQPNNNFYVTITLPVWIADIPAGVSLEKVAVVLTYSRWNEGRYPFDEELIHHGLQRLIRHAIREVVDSQLQEHYGNEVVPDEDRNGQTARWYLESEKIKGPSVIVEGSIEKAKLEQQCGECRGEGMVNHRVEYGRISKTVTCGKCGGTGVEK